MTQQIFSLIPKIMGEVGSISKDKKNTIQNYSFRGIDDVYLAFQGLLAKHGVFYAPEIISYSREDRQSARGGNLIYTVIRVKYHFFAPDGSFVTAETIGEAMDSGDKSANKAMSAALKYAMLQVFCIPTEGDNDTENSSPDPLPVGTIDGQKQSTVPPDNTTAPPKSAADDAPKAKAPTRAHALMALARGRCWTKEEVKDYITMKFAVDKSADLKQDQYDLLTTTIKTLTPTEAFTQLNQSGQGSFDEFKE